MQGCSILAVVYATIACHPLCDPPLRSPACFFPSLPPPRLSPEEEVKRVLFIGDRRFNLLKRQNRPYSHRTGLTARPWPATRPGTTLSCKLA
jgi:hypothetical protein